MVAYLVNLNKYESAWTHWIALYVNGDNIAYFHNFVVEHIPKEIKKFIANKNIMTNIFRKQAYNSIMCRYFCIRFIDSMLKGNSLLGYTNFFFLKDIKRDDKIILKYFQ